MAITLLIFSFRHPPPTEQHGQQKVPTGVPVATVTVEPTTPEETGAGLAAVPFDAASANTLMDRISQRQPLSADDAVVKAKLIAIIPADTGYGVLHETQNIRIDYTESADMFQVEILTTDIPLAKTEGNLWFFTQGLSQEGICKLPVMYYLDYDIAEQLRNANVALSPLAPGC